MKGCKRSRRWRCRMIGVAGVLVLAGVMTAAAQLPPNISYDGRPVLARVRFAAVAEPSGCQEADGLGDGGWSHDYPMSVQGMMKAATNVTSMEAPVDSFVTTSVTDSDFMRYPVAMVTEPGCWNPTDAEVKLLRTYMEKGGFLFLDDLTFGDGTREHLELSIARVEVWMHRVLPEGKLVPIPATDPLFDGFFKINPTDVPGYGATAGGGGAIYGVYRDNDPNKPLMTIVTYRGILGHHWRWKGGVGSGLGEGDTPSGKAYRLGLNILVYALSH